MTWDFYTELKDAFLFKFLGRESKWVKKAKLYGQFQDPVESGLNFILRKLKMITDINVTLSEDEEVELILVHMLPKIEEICSAHKPGRVNQLLNQLQQYNCFQQLCNLSVLIPRI